MADFSHCKVTLNKFLERYNERFPTGVSSVVMNDLGRCHLVAEVIDRVPQLGPKAAYAKQAIRDKLIDHKQYIAKHGEDLPEIWNWKWGATKKSMGKTCSRAFSTFDIPKHQTIWARRSRSATCRARARS